MDYPNTFPLPNDTTYAGVVDPGLVRSPMDSPAPFQTTLFGSPTIEFTWSFNMDRDLYWNEWLPWVTANGYDWFNMQIMSPHNPVVILSEHRCRFTSDTSMTKLGYDWVSVTISAEVLQSDTEDALSPSARTYDTIQGGTPSSPSADHIIAGDPVTPSTDTVQANLYIYTVG